MSAADEPDEPEDQEIDSDIYDGNEDATVERVTEYLLSHYDVTEEDVAQALEEQKDILVTGIHVMSYANYVGDKIADAMEWGICE
jgi:hypothetical protein